MNLNERRLFSVFYGTLSNYNSIDSLKVVLEESKPVSMVFDHRLVLSSWILWHKMLGTTPNLITFDAHRDLCEENDLKSIIKHIKKTLNESLDLSVFEMLDRKNDTHINMACHLGIFNNVFVISNDSSNELYPINKSNIQVFNAVDSSIINVMSNEPYILDIDLDYFFDKNETNNLYQINELRLQSFLDQKIIFPDKLVGITIAIEASYCGGIINAIKVYEKLEHKFFNKPVFIDYYQDELAVLNEAVT